MSFAAFDLCLLVSYENGSKREIYGVRSFFSAWKELL
jgi:hypothetical protein